MNEELVRYIDQLYKQDKYLLGKNEGRKDMAEKTLDFISWLNFDNTTKESAEFKELLYFLEVRIGN